MGHAHSKASPNVYGRYQTLFRIAAGGMAEVYAARVRGEAGFQKLVALKRMLPHLTDDERFVTMFMDEGKLAANISSPNVVSTLDLGRADDGSLYLVMELVVGTTLSTLLRNAAKVSASVPIDVAVEMLAQAAQGLHDAHEAKTPFGAPLQLIHRDISPQNILVGSDGRVRITDFGVARAVLRRTKTSTGEFKGKLSYFSPEQCADKELDRRSDLFSLGVVAWETLTTRRLFHAENPLAVLERVTRMPIPSAHAVRPEVPPAVADVVAKALERDRDARYSSVAEFAQALRAASRETVGIADRHRVAELVSEFGGETLERVQEQLKRSLSNPDSIGEDGPLDDAKTEISSGIVFRQEDGAPIAATPPAPTPPAMAESPPSFSGPQSALSSAALSSAALSSASVLSTVQPAPAPSKLPLVIASLVAILGLGAGAAIGLMAASADDPDTLPEVQVLPSAGEPTTDVEPPPSETPDPTTEGAETAPAPEPAAGSTVRRRPPRRGGARGGAERDDTEPGDTERGVEPVEVAPEPPPVVEPEPEPEPVVRTGRRSSTRIGTTIQRTEPTPTPVETRRGNGMMGVDDFNRFGR